MADAVLIIVAVLGIGFVATRLSEWMRLPHSVFLVVLGLAAGWALRSLDPAFITPLTANFPEIILYVLLPPLIFESAYNIDLKALQRDLVPVTALAVVGLILSTIMVGWGIHWGLAIALMPALLFGALISATDPVAVVALFKEVGAPKRLNLLVEGESLFNDGTAIVAFTALLGLLSVSTVTSEHIGQALVRFLLVFFGGVAIGGVIALLLSPVVHFCRNGTAQIGLTIVGAYVSFIVADHFLHLSGVMSTVALGLFMGTRARLEFNREALHGMGHMWEFMALAANTVVFIAVGLTVDTQLLLKSVEYIPLTLLIVTIARAISIVAVVPLLNKLKLCQPISMSYQFIMFWGGLRGGLALALVLLLPDSLAEKPLFLALATSVVLTTLLINALTIGPALRWLGIDRLTSEEQSIFRHSLAKLWQSIYNSLHNDTKGGLLSPQVVDRFVRQTVPLTRRQLPNHQQDDESELHIGLLLFQVQGDFIARSLGLQTERWLDRSFRSGLITRAVYNKVTEAIHEQEAKAMQMLEQFQHPSPSDLIAHASPFHHLSADRIADLARNAQPRILHKGESFSLGGETHAGFLVVKSGMYEHVQNTKDHRRHAHFITGDAVDGLNETGVLKTVVPGEVLLVSRPLTG
ncbi:MAG: sodium:proton antiporter [Betaproteobacteria bacterium]|nr:sodium:proton antiporter [Betaproteobacteria bacterium]